MPGSSRAPGVRRLRSLATPQALLDTVAGDLSDLPEPAEGLIVLLVPARGARPYLYHTDLSHAELAGAVLTLLARGVIESEDD